MVISSVTKDPFFGFILSSFLICAVRVEAQANTRCPPGWEWARNSLNQDPCEMLVLLESQCRGTPVRVPALSPPDTVNYTRPSSGSYSALQCECNAPVFSILQACVECQGGNTTTWRLWMKECPSVDDELPFSIPQGSAIPRWAFAGDAGTDFIFLAAFAMSVGRDPEATPETTGPSTVAISSSSISTPSPLATVLPASISSSGEPGPTEAPGEGSDEKSSVGVGAIVGVSVGAVVLIVATMVFVFLFARHQRLRQERALSQAMPMTPPPVSRMQRPLVRTRTKTPPVIPLHMSPEPPDSGSRSRRLVVINPSESPASHAFTPPLTRVLSGPGGADMHPSYPQDGGRV